MTTPLSEAADIPVNDATVVLTYSPFVLDVPGRRVSLELKAAATQSGDSLPIISWEDAVKALDNSASLRLTRVGRSLGIVTRRGSWR